MSTRTIQQLVPTLAVSEGAGVTVHRAIGTPALRNLDPFLMLDHFGGDDPDEYIAGFPEHPHRGFITFTYMLDGHMEHHDSMGNRGDLKSGGAQWMKAASGVIHSEMPRQSEGRMRGFQLWINLPASEKMSAPAYQEFAADAIPEVVEDDMTARVLAGEFARRRGVIDDPHTQLLYLDIALAPEAHFEFVLTAGHNAFLYLFEGGALLGGDTPIPLHTLAVLNPGDLLDLEASEDGARFILVSGKPLREPIARHGPFVMNTREEVEQAVADYRAGKLVRSE